MYKLISIHDNFVSTRIQQLSNELLDIEVERTRNPVVRAQVCFEYARRCSTCRHEYAYIHGERLQHCTGKVYTSLLTNPEFREIIIASIRLFLKNPAIRPHMNYFIVPLCEEITTETYHDHSSVAKALCDTLQVQTILDALAKIIKDGRKNEKKAATAAVIRIVSTDNVDTFSAHTQLMEAIAYLSTWTSKKGKALALMADRKLAALEKKPPKLDAWTTDAATEKPQPHTFDDFGEEDKWE